MEELRIRLMKEEDLEAVCRIEKEAFSMPWTEKGFADALTLPHALFLTAEVQGQAVGYCGFYQSLEEAEITNVAVKAEFRGRGIADQMLKELMCLGKERGVLSYMLEVRISNAPAIHVYESLGFEKQGIRKRFYEKPVEDAVIMWRHCQI